MQHGTSVEPRSTKHDLLSAIGYLLGVSYPVLALSTGVRALYQLLLKTGVTNYVAPSLSAVAAVCYLFAALGFLHRRRWTWRVSVTLLAFEMVMVLLIGTLTVLYPDAIGRTVWHHFGIDYGFVPLIQPLLGLIWLFWPETRATYGAARS